VRPRQFSFRLRLLGGVTPRRLASACAAVGMILVISTGVLNSLEQRLSDAWFSIANVAPSGKTIIVTTDRVAARHDAGVRMPRRELAEVLLKLDAAGVNRILIELGLAEQTSDSDDEYLEQVLTRLGPKIGISLWAIVSGSGKEARWRRTGLNERFARLVALTASDIALDYDAQVRKSGIENAGLPPMMSSSVWLSNTNPSGKVFRIDFGIDLERLPVVDAESILLRGAESGVFHGANVIIGSHSSTTGYGISVPHYRELRRPQITALATETLLLGRQLREIPATVSSLGVVVLAALVALWCLRLNVVASAGLVVGVASCAIGAGAQLQVSVGVIAPTASAIAAALIGFAAAQVTAHPALERLRQAARAAFGGIDLRLAGVLDDTPDGLLTFDSNGVLLSINSAARHLFGLDTMGEPGDYTLSGIFGPQAEAVLAATRTKQNARVLTTTRRDGVERRLELAVSATPTEQGSIGVATVRDVTEQQAQIDALNRIATRDALTGVLNRRAFEQILEATCAGVAVQSALLVCDLDGFKLVNDTFGHQAGDTLLREIASRLIQEAGPNAVVARLGGDEFAIVVPHASEILAAMTARRLVAAVSQPIQIGVRHATVGVSIGIALSSAHAEPRALFDGADEAMYRAKRSRSGYKFAREPKAA
jgi:diguanylate cyclase (GGDEF)-like protein/PAS domain S-box-containing protein